MGQWVAVAYDNKYYIGKVTAIEQPVLDDEDEISINYLSRGQNGKYKWPKKKDTDVVGAKYIFCANPDVHPNEADLEFTLENADIVKKKYEKYRKSYMQ